MVNYLIILIKRRKQQCRGILFEKDLIVNAISFNYYVRKNKHIRLNKSPIHTFHVTNHLILGKVEIIKRKQINVSKYK